MSELRHLFSARAARPKIEGAVRAIVRVAVYLAQADGVIGEPELEALVDGVRKHLGALVGTENVEAYVSLSSLLDEAREARRVRNLLSEDDYLSSLGQALEGNLRKAAVDVALDVIRADGKLMPGELLGLQKLCAVLGVDVPRRER